MSTKYDWPVLTEAEKAKNLELTDPGQIGKAVDSLMGGAGAFERAVQDAVEKQIKAMGMTLADRRYLQFPEAGRDGGTLFTARDVDGQDNERWSDLSPDSQRRKRILVKAWFKRVLFGRDAVKLLADHGQCDEVVARTLAGQTDSAGGYLIPPGFIPYLVKDVPRLSVLFPLVTVMPTGQNDAGTMPSVATNVTTSWGTENTAMSSGDPVLGQVTYTINRHNAFCEMPRELVNDSNPSIIDTLVDLFNAAVAEERDRVIAHGSGSGRPQGLYYSTTITDVSGITAVSYDNLLKLKYSLDQRWWGDPSTRWVFNQNVMQAISALKDDNGLPLIRDSLMVGQLPTLLGLPMAISNSCRDTFIGLGALRNYVWFDRQDMGFEWSDTAGDSFKKHQRYFKLWERCDGKFAQTPTSSFVRSKALTGITALVTPN